VGAGARVPDRTAQTRSLQRRAPATFGRRMDRIGRAAASGSKRPVGGLDFEFFRSVRLRARGNDRATPAERNEGWCQVVRCLSTAYFWGGNSDLLEAYEDNLL
jgi:hypothetical protein